MINSVWAKARFSGAARAAFVFAGLSVFGTALHAQTGTALVRHAPTLNGAVNGSLQQMSGESVTLNGGASVSGSLLVPGTPTITLNGHPTYGGTITGTGSTSPTGYSVILNSATLGHVVTRTNALTLPTVAAPPAPTGTRDVTINNSSQSAGNFATLRNLTLNGNVGAIAVPAGTYGSFTANSGGFIFGVAGATQPAVYNLQGLTLNGSTQIQIVGPVVLTLANGPTLNGGSVGSSAHPEWLTLKVASGGLTLNGCVYLYGYVTAPAGTVTLNGMSQLVGGLISDRLTINGGCTLRLVNQSPVVSITSPANGASFTAPASFTLTASASDPDGSITKVSFFQGSTLLGTSTTAPYQFSVSGLAAGSYSFTAVATDNLGATTTSAAVNVTVSKAVATVTLGNLSQTYDGTAKSATATTSPAGLTVVLTYNGSGTAPSSAGSYTVVGTVSDPNYAGSATGTLVIAKATPVITWSTPASINYGTPLSAAQLDATANVPGTFTYTPAAGTVLSAGSQTLNVTFTPADTTDYTTATASTTLTVAQAVATVTLGNLSQTYDGTAKSATATTSPAGLTVVLTYNGSSIVPTNAGSYTVVGTVVDPNYVGSATGTLVIAKATPVITWNAPVAITYGTALDGTQLNAVANVSGTFTYTPAAGTVLNAGSQTLNVAFTPADTADYNTATASTTLTVNQATATVTLDNLNQTYDGTAKSATATTSPAGLTVVLTYNGSGTAPSSAGSYTVVGTVSDPNYVGSATGTLVIAQATPIITWATPALINYGTPLSAAQLDATANVPGTFAYSPDFGTVLSAGSQTLNVTFTPADATDYTTATASTTLVVNAPPTVSLTAPTDGSIFTAPAADISLTANASDSDGTIAKVDFYQNGTLLGTSTTAPYQFDWINVAAGNYTLTAVATDNNGATTTSASVSIIVNNPPSVTLTAPTDGSTFNAPASFTLTANASDSDGTIAKVDFFQSGTLIGTATTAPYQFNVSGLAAADSYTFTAVATDNLGATTTSTQITISVNAPPTVSLTAPANGSAFVVPASFTLAATAADSDGVVTKVDFYQNGTLIGTSTTAPYQFSVSGLGLGSYTFTAVATDDDGASTTSAPVSVSVNPNQPPVVSLTAPANGATFTAPASIALSASASDPDGSVAKVDFYQNGTLIGTSTTAPYQFNWANVAAGSYTLTAVATDNLGAATTSAPVSITVSNPAPATITFDSASSGTTTVAATSISWSHTLNSNAGSNRIVIVGVVSRGSTATPTSVTFNSVPMTLIPNSVAVADNGTLNQSQLYYLLDAALPPSAGTYTVQATFSGSQSTSNSPLGSVIALTNVNQATLTTGFTNTTGGTAASPAPSGQIATSISTTLTSLTTGSWVVDTIGVGSTKANILATNAAMTQRYNLQGASGEAGSTEVVDATGSATLSWANANARVVQSLAVLTPALTVPTPPAITVQPVSQAVNVGDNVTFGVTATGTAPLTYQWYDNGAPLTDGTQADGSVVSGSASTTLSLSNAQTADSGSYTVIIGNASGSVTSNPAALSVTVAPPAITTQPVSLTPNLGDNVTFSVIATGTAPLAYQWYDNGTALANGTQADGSIVSGSASATLSLNNVQAADDGSYTVIVTNSVNTATSTPATLAVNTGPLQPVITTQPLSQTVGASFSASFTVAATGGTSTLTYQWFYNGAPLADGTQADGSIVSGSASTTLSLANVQLTDAGSYTVTVSNVIGTATSNPATLTVNSLTSPSAEFNLTGFATLNGGTTGGGVIPVTDPGYVQVSTPLQLANAVLSFNKGTGVKVIEIMNELDLGWNEIGTAIQTMSSTPFSEETAPQLHPVLLVTGMSKLNIQGKNGGLTIFSANGATIKHCEFNIKGTTNVIVRNLKFDENWEWDEQTKGSYDENDWDCMDTANGGSVQNVWVDHCTFTKSYDGIVDFKGNSSFITISWCKYTGDDGATNPNSFVRQQFNNFESTGISHYPMYNFFRTNGFTEENMVTVNQGHDKTHLAGPNDLDPNNNDISITFHHEWLINVWDRCVPRLRGGNVHDYDIYADGTGALAAKTLRDNLVAAMSASAKSTANNTYHMEPPMNGAISTEGGALLVEKSVYIDQVTMLRNNQTDVTNPAYTGKILALDTIYTDPIAVTTVRGNSTDAGSTMGPIQAPIIPFSWNGYASVPYSYTTDDPSNLPTILQAGAGAGTISWDKSNWLKTSY